MHIHCLGLNHQTAPIELRDRLAFTEDNARAALSQFSEDESQQPAELILLSTCNRIEIYSASSDQEPYALEQFLAATRGVPAEEFNPYLYAYTDEQAIQHLFKVSAGLDSMVLGEPQILGQVTEALRLARQQNTSGPVLNRLFQAAIHAGKRARTETAISRQPASIASLAVSLCEHTQRDIRTAQIVVLGAGEMAELTVKTLRNRKIEKILIVNRTLERGQSLARRWDVEATTLDQLENAVARADILIASTSAPHTVLTAETVRAAMSQRPERALALIDIAAPRDIDPTVAAIPGVTLIDIDHLNAKLEQSLTARSREVPHVQAILAEEEAEFLSFFRSLDMLPLIANLRQQAESIRQAELQKTLNHLPDLTEVERARIEALSEALVKKLLAQPTLRLREEAVCHHAPEYADVVRTLFGLESREGYCIFSGNSCPIDVAAD